MVYCKWAVVEEREIDGQGWDDVWRGDHDDGVVIEWVEWHSSHPPSQPASQPGK